MSGDIANQSLRIVIVEDEAPARQKLKMQLAQVAGVELVAECDNPQMAIQTIEQYRPDVVLLDIELGELNGFDVLDAISHPCHIIFTTAYGEYAIRAFESRALDYLLKPFNIARLREALSRVQVTQHHQNNPFQMLGEKPLISKVGDKMRVLDYHDIVYITTSHGICRAVEATSEYHLEGTLESLLAILPGHYLRVHRNCIVNAKKVWQIEKWQNGSYLLRFRDHPHPVTTSRSGAGLIKQAFNL
ncbi:LytR/AlgR family response regulator transcription factor [Rheinheimera texasensis]|uniref:LytR/AlgR family response regulator transcription factor n=1 Tax=Rheinheimera texasensis TaxID=306205 RepID=UPI0004E14E46|nr:LytTR family DNA-binding domain-containing protein [Rheinheimera texasensis]